MYRPTASEKGVLVYKIASHIIQDTQGAIIASLIFCFCNGEVHCYLKSLAIQNRLGSTRNDTYRRNSMTATQYSIVAPATRRTIRPVEHPPNYIALSPIDKQGEGLFNISNGHHCS
ncbi:hypothetical protein ScPMuIL_015833 [Solemya velum]